MSQKYDKEIWVRRPKPYQITKPLACLGRLFSNVRSRGLPKVKRLWVDVIEEDMLHEWWMEFWIGEFVPDSYWIGPGTMTRIACMADMLKAHSCDFICKAFLDVRLPDFHEISSAAGQVACSIAVMSADLLISSSPSFNEQILSLSPMIVEVFEPTWVCKRLP